MVEYAEARDLRPPPPSPDIVLESIVSTIVDRLNPRRLILFGSRARGDASQDSDYDVVVEVESAVATHDALVREVDSWLGDRNWSLNVVPRIAGEIERSANDPGTVDWDIVREGKVLYAREGVSFTLAALVRVPSRVREGPSDSPQWAALAKLDLDEARFSLLHKRPWRYACFLAQQAAENYIKALLVQHLVRPGHTHNLNELLVFLKGARVYLPELQDDCKFLAPFAVKSRYGRIEHFDEGVGRKAVAAAERIAAAIEPLLN